MILAIVGSVKLASHPAVFKEVRRVLWQYKPDEVITTTSDGVDNIVVRVCREMGAGLRAFKAEVPLWDGRGQVGYKQRSMQIATLCDRLICITEENPERYGPRWTMEEAARLGKPTEEKIIAA